VPPYGQPPAAAYGQPAYGQPPNEPPPPNYLVWAILSTLLGCWPFGIAAIVFAAQVDGKWSAGDRFGARDASRKAKQFAAISIALQLVLFVLWVVYALLVLASSAATGY
jgi:uncharacterized RDD family membrane protein YckC